MPELPFSVAYYGRPTYGLPSTRQVNAFSEPTKGGPKGAARIARPGLTLQYTNGNGPVLRAFQNPGLFNGDPFFVSGGTLYKADTSLGAVPYGPQPRMAGTNSQLAIVSGGALYVYDGTALTLVQFYDDGVSRLPPFSSVVVLYDIFVLTLAGTNQFVWSNVNDVTSINAANIASAQTSPDPIVEVTVLAEELYFLKTLATEIWDYSPIINSAGQVTQPFQLAQGRTYIRGTPAQGSVVTRLDNSMFWVSDSLEVYRAGAVPAKVSTPFIDDRLRAAMATIDQTTAFALGIEGHWFYIFNLPMLGESYAYDCTTQEWAQWGTQATFDSVPGLYIGGCATGQGATIWVGDSTSGDVYLADAANNTDNGMTRAVIVTGALWVTGKTMRFNNVALACVRGVGNAAAPDPRVWLRISYDGARTWTAWMPQTLGPVGGYLYKAIWRNLGLIQQPGIVCEFAVLDAVNFTAEGASYNEPRQ